ncbi:efflux RND transporter periplasmic adaptor subunit [Pseudomarimonas salicorniae]|uniref:Efflux RND transporter periplasmic adaptor subunit n=1 Tax=Pseudomarimonas salicorniae TaxID=2933270 RepID=A0ABT0GK71_9GAMM|nr:efflux RND transporter periplasmic adaptor subunit [Lysobacter sp. CAU 1642]MCK7594941.1 efflux RND transporter periplasmic adaptor subunit [Lysobacter sp. CAU 1642]
MTSPDRSAPFSFRRTLGFSALAIALTLALSACGGGKPDADAQAKQADDVEQKTDKDGKLVKEAQPIPVEVVPVSRRDIEASYAGTAALEAPEEAQVVAKTSGVLLQLLTEEGQQVKAGEVLARIDPDRARLEVARAEATLRKLEAEFARSKELFERKLVAADAHERLRFDVETQRAAWNLAKLELSYTNVVAPISGVVAQRMVKAGNLIQLNQAMFRIVNIDELEAVLNVPERELGKLQTGLAVSLSVDALPGRRFKGVIDRISPVIDAATGTFRATARFEADDGKLMPGMFGRIQVIYDRRAETLSVPRVALIEENADPAVFVVNEDKVVRTPVTLGYINGEFAEVLAGLEEGDQVVTAGKVAVRDGSKVQIIVPSSALARASTESIAGNGRQ